MHRNVGFYDSYFLFHLKYEMLKNWWIWKIEIWCEELVYRYQTVPYQPGALIWGGQLSGSVSNLFET